jgi:hypothetical protein
LHSQLQMKGGVLVWVQTADDGPSLATHQQQALQQAGFTVLKHHINHDVSSLGPSSAHASDEVLVHPAQRLGTILQQLRLMSYRHQLGARSVQLPVCGCFRTYLSVIVTTTEAEGSWQTLFLSNCEEGEVVSGGSSAVTQR